MRTDSDRTRKMIAPVVITVIAVVYYVFYFCLLMWMLPGILWKLLFGMIPLALAGVMIYVCVQRIQEIEKGEEDDLSKY